MPDIRLRLDPWPAEFDAAVQFEELEAEPSARVDVSVESASWEPVRPAVSDDTAALFFVDGSRRVEARLLAERDQQLVHGLLGSLAVGAVCLSAGKVAFDAIHLERCLILGAGLHRQGFEIRIGEQTLSFQGLSIAENSPREVLAALQNRMRQREAELAQRLGRDSAVVYVDGSLSYFATVDAPVVGIVKTLHLPYLAAPEFSLVTRLGRGQRTPLFAITDGKYDRYSWFLRVAAPGPLDHSVAGILRLETRAGLGVEAAIRLAHLSCLHLTGLASDRIREPRAPQNLIPVGALEQELHRRMGDALSIRRAIEQKLYQEVLS